MKFSLGIFVLLTALALSVVAAWFSITGMVSLFAASATGVIAMMVCLEFGKLVASGVLKMNWDNPNFNKLIKSYLFVSVGVLMLITSIGIYGYLSAGHLEQKAPLAGLSVQTQQLDIKVAQRMDENARIEKRMDQIDKNIGVFLENDQATKGLSASNRLSSERTKLQAQMDSNNEQINKLNEELVPLKMETSEVEAKLGPVKYVAALFGWSDTESAVRLVILILMVAFDPLAVVLMLSGLIIMREWHDEKNPPKDDPTPAPEPTPVTPPETIEKFEAWMDKIDPAPADDVLDATEETNFDISEIRYQDDHPIEPDHREIVFPEIIDRQADTIETLRKELSQLGAIKEELAQEADRWKEVAGNEFSRASALFEEKKSVDIGDRDKLLSTIKSLRDELAVSHANAMSQEPVKIMDRESLLKLLEENPAIIGEIEEIIETDFTKMTDREKLLDILENNPSMINDIAEILTGQVANNKPTNWLG